MEDLTKSWSKLTLSDCEGSNIRLMKKQGKTKCVLAAKFLTGRALSLDAIAKRFSPLWRVTKEFKARKEGEHVVLFALEDKIEMMKVLAA